MTLASIRDTIDKTMAKAMSGLQDNMAKQLSELQVGMQADVKKKLGELRADINRKMEENTEKIEASLLRLNEAEHRISEVETFHLEVQEALEQMQRAQLELKSKITDLEGYSRRNNIRIYGLKEGAEGTSMLLFVEDFLKTELGDSIGLTELGIERAHRVPGPRPANSASPRSTLVRFFKYTTRERVIVAAWRKKITMDGKRVFFDHDYATDVMD